MAVGTRALKVLVAKRKSKRTFPTRRNLSTFDKTTNDQRHRHQQWPRKIAKRVSRISFWIYIYPKTCPSSRHWRRKLLGSPDRNVPISNIYSHIHRRQSQQAFGESKCCCQSNSQGCKDHNLRRVRTASLTAFFDIYC